MHKFTAGVLVNRSQMDVFNFLSDPANLPKWNDQMKSAGWTSNGAPGVGSTMRAIMKMGEFPIEITQWDVPNRFGFESHAVPFPMKSIAQSFRLEPVDGGTRVTLNAQLEMVGILTVAEGLMGVFATRMNQDHLNVLKELLQAG